MKRDFLALSDLVVSLAARLKGSGGGERPLAGRSVGLIFAKSSTRTRVSFEVGAFQLGAHSVFLSVHDIELGHGEPLRDTARVLSRYLDALVIRTHAHQDAEELARYAYLLTIQESIGTWQGKIVAWVGDGNNVANASRLPVERRT